MNVTVLRETSTRIQHNHLSREIREKGSCLACDEFWLLHQTEERN